MGEGNDGIDVFSRSFLPERFCQLVYDAIYTAYRGDNPYLVTDSHITVPATVAVKGQTFVGNVQSRVLRLPGIVLQTFQIRFDILLVYQGACGISFRACPIGKPYLMMDSPVLKSCSATL